MCIRKPHFMAINEAFSQIHQYSVCLFVCVSTVPENIRRDDELLVVQVISELVQVVHVRQLLPELVTEGKREEETFSATDDGSSLSAESDVCLPDQRFENVPDDSDKVCRMNDVQSLQVLLVFGTTTTAVS